MMCVMNVYGPKTRRMEAEKEEFRDALERMMGLVELDVMLLIAGDFNAHVGVVEPDDRTVLPDMDGERGIERV